MALTLAVHHGDITTYDGDAIVNAANNWLQLGAGVAGAIRSAGGPTIQHECDEHGPIAVGQAAITGAGNLHVKWVIHAAAMGDRPVSATSIRESTSAALTLAAERHIKKLAFPVLGAGIGGFELRQSAEIMRDVIRELPAAQEIEEIVFFGFNRDDAKTLSEVILG